MFNCFKNGAGTVTRLCSFSRFLHELFAFSALDFREKKAVLVAFLQLGNACVTDNYGFASRMTSEMQQVVLVIGSQVNEHFEEKLSNCGAEIGSFGGSGAQLVDRSNGAQVWWKQRLVK